MQNQEKQYDQINLKPNIFPYTDKEALILGIKSKSKTNKEMLFPTQMRKLRKDSNMTQQQVADNIGVTKSSVGLYENGDTIPDIKTFAKIAICFKVSYDYLLGDSDSIKREYYDIRQTTGLIDPAIETLKELYCEGFPSKIPLEVLNLLLSNQDFYFALAEIDNIIKAYKIYLQTMAASNDPLTTFDQEVIKYRIENDKGQITISGLGFKEYMMQRIINECSLIINNSIEKIVSDQCKTNS